MDRRVLVGVKVVDITQLFAGPLCGRMLADLGAEIIKIDRLPSPNGGPVRSASAGPALNLGKRSIAIDLHSEDGQAVARALIDRADVVVENFRPGVLDRMGLGSKQPPAERPRLSFAPLPAARPPAGRRPPPAPRPRRAAPAPRPRRPCAPAPRGGARGRSAARSGPSGRRAWAGCGGPVRARRGNPGW